MLKAYGENVHAKKTARLIYCSKCKSGFVVKRVFLDDDIEAFMYGKEEETVKFCPFCGFDGSE